MFNVIFNEIDMPDFLKVKAVNTTIFPEINHSFKNIAGGKGTVEMGTSFGAKEIQLDFKIVVPKDKSLMEVQRELSVWLMGDNFKLSPLIISDEPDMVYMAKVKDSTSVKDSIFIGEGTITFIVPKGVASYRYEKHGAINGKAIGIYYLGTAETYPLIEWTPARDFGKGTVLKFTHAQTGDVVILEGSFKAGQKVLVDCNKKLVKVGGNLALSMISLDSEWIKIKDKGINTVSCNLEGALKCTYKENWL